MRALRGDCLVIISSMFEDAPGRPSFGQFLGAPRGVHAQPRPLSHYIFHFRYHRRACCCCCWGVGGKSSAKLLLLPWTGTASPAALLLLLDSFFVDTLSRPDIASSSARHVISILCTCVNKRTIPRGRSQRTLRYTRYHCECGKKRTVQQDLGRRRSIFHQFLLVSKRFFASLLGPHHEAAKQDACPQFQRKESSIIAEAETDTCLARKTAGQRPTCSPIKVPALKVLPTRYPETT